MVWAVLNLQAAELSGLRISRMTKMGAIADCKDVAIPAAGTKAPVRDVRPLSGRLKSLQNGTLS